MDLLLLVAAIGGLILVAIIILLLRQRGTGTHIRRRYDWRRHGERSAQRNPQTGEWEDWDGTPYGAIDTLLTDDGVDGGDPGEQWG